MPQTWVEGGLLPLFVRALLWGFPEEVGWDRIPVVNIQVGPTTWPYSDCKPTQQWTHGPEQVYTHGL
jgi:hypothetical protein